MPEAARLTDPIAHTSALAGFLVGAVIGIALIAAVAFATFTCGFGVALLAGLAAGIGASAILSLGEAIGKMFSSPSGAITSGSLNVFVNSRNAAFATSSTVTCSKHTPVPLVAEGSGNVFYNQLPAARKGDAITCGAKIDDGSQNTFVGGSTVRYLEVEDEVPAWLRTAVDWAFALAGLVGGLAGLLKAAGGLSRAVLPCAAKFIGGYVIGEAVGRTVIGPAISRVYGGLFGHPVDVTTGRKLLLASDETDFVLQSPVPLACGRFYASNIDEAGSLGRGWVLPWELRLQRRGQHLWLRDAQGRESGFPLLKPGESSFSDTEQKYLACTHEGRLVLYDLNEQYFDFGELPEGDGEATALLQRIEDASGHWLLFHRAEGSSDVRIIQASGGQQLRLSYLNIQGRLTEIELLHQRKRQVLVRYEHDANGQLAAVIDANGQVVRRFEYADGLMVAHHNALGFSCRYQWQTFGNGSLDGQPRVIELSTSEGERAVFSYDPGGRRTQVVDELDRQAEWLYDEHFQVIECIDLDGKRYRTKYTASGQPELLQLPAEADQVREVRFGYDEAGRIVSETDVLGRSTQTHYDRKSLRPDSITLPDGSRWQAQYDATGRLLKTIDPLGREEHYDYPEASASPWPVARYDALGGRKTLQWTRSGWLSAFTDCSGKTTRYDYDIFGALVATTNALDQTTQIQRLPTGQPVRVELPDSSEERFDYDAAGLLIARHDAAGHSTRWLRNARGQVLQAMQADVNQLAYRYDPQGRLVALASGNANYRFSYDDGDRLIEEFRPDGVVRQLRYGAFGQALGQREIGIPAAGWDPEATIRIIEFERDAAGRLLSQRNNTRECHYSWDDGDRLLKAHQLPTEHGRSLGIIENTVSFRYDKAGRLLAERGRDGTVAYVLDALDNTLALDLPNEQRIQWLRYGSGHVHQMRCGEQVIADIERDDLHREVLRSQGRLTQALGYDALGRRSWQSAVDAATSNPQNAGPGQGRLWRSYRYSAEGELAAIEDRLRGSQQFQYDPAGQLLQRQATDGHGMGQGSLEQFAWDAAGNLLDALRKGGGPVGSSTSGSAGRVQGNRLLMWQDIRLGYDPWGNLATKVRGSAQAQQTQQFIFDADNRLLAVRSAGRNGSTETRFDYDALGRRIASREVHTELDGSISHRSERGFVWQGLRMVQELRESGLSNYLYSPDSPYTPLARVDASIAETAASANRVYHFHTDLVGTPMEVTDEQGELAWAGDYSAWGKQKTDELRALQARIEQPLRYPGQYEDTSTGLHYNTFRYYDPDIGRFISQDPIGLGGGENLYAYAPNPSRWLDPYGLNKATWQLFDSNGRLIDSGDLTPDRGARNIPGRVGDTEQKILRHIEEAHGPRLKGSQLNIESKPTFIRTPTGKTVPVQGMAPCSFCDDAMEQFSKKHGMQIEYKYSGKTRVYPKAC